MSIMVVLFHLMACIALIAIVLLQTGKGAEMAAAFGGASQTLFGGTGGSSFMSKLTMGAAIVFMITSLLLSYMYRPGFRGGRSVMTDIPIETAPGTTSRAADAGSSRSPPGTARDIFSGATGPRGLGNSTAAPKQPAAQGQTKPQPDTKAKPAPATGQPQQGQKKAPAQKQQLPETILCGR